MRGTRVRPSLLALGGLVGAAALLSGCGGGGGAADAAPSAPVSSAPVSSAPASSTPAAPPVPTAPPASPSPAPSGPTATVTPSASRTAPTVATCVADRLAVTVRPDAGGGTAGSVYESVVLVNRGTVACTLDGHPGVSYVVGATGKQVGAAATRDGVPALVTLAPGGAAHASLRVVDYQNIDRETCQSSPVAGLRIYPPDSTAATFVAAPGSTCADPSVQLLTVGPVQAGE